jgi:uncharacterized protein (TIGR03083 family)
MTHDVRVSSLTFDRYCHEIGYQTDLLAGHVKGTDGTAPIASCPGWDLDRLLRHVGGDHRWAEEVVRTRADGPIPDEGVNDPAVYADIDGAALGPWLSDGAAALAASLRAAGPRVQVWTPAEDRFTTAFWARRMAHETVVHRADAALATGAEFRLDDDLAADGVEEWLEFSTVSEAYEPRPDTPELLGAGRSLRFHAIGAGQWFVDLEGDRPTWRIGYGEAAVSVRGSVTDLLLFLYRRPAPSVEVRGETDLLDLWLTRTGFWLEV